MTYIFRSVLAAALLLIFSSFAAAGDCSFITGLEASSRFECGKIAVPEDHADQDGRKITISYLVIKASNERSKPDPVIYFSGGPGGASLGGGFVGFLSQSTLTADRDLVLFDQRGIQYSSALPDIGEAVFSAMAADTDMAGERKLIAKVLADYRAIADEKGIDLGTYNSFQNARDVGALMKHLGYPEYNLWGISYGTRLARLIQDLFPEMVRSVTLDSPNLMTDDFLLNRMTSYSASADKIIKACAQDAKCSKSYPKLEKDYREVIAKVRKNPIKVSTASGDFHINSQDAMYFLRRQLYRTNALELFPGFVKALKEKDMKVLKAAVDAELEDVNTGAFNTSMFLAVSAFESMDKGNTPEVIAKEYKNLPHFPEQLAFFTNLYLEGLNWHGGYLPVSDRKFRRSSVPTMIMVNQYDPVTPPENGKLFQEDLETSYLYIIDEGGHSGGDFPCKLKMMSGFMDEPSSEPNASCLRLFED